MRTPIVAGNWKMHNTVPESVTLAKAIKDGAAGIKNTEIVLAPPFTSLFSVYDVIKGTNISLASQNIFFEDKGAYTGEVAPGMIKDVGCTYAIIGHSERRKYFHDRDEDVNLKVKKALATGLKPIVCVGETEEERSKGITEFVVGVQVKKALYEINSLSDIVIAYEPVWAIGTGLTAGPADVAEAHGFVREMLRARYGEKGNEVRILYGGSVKPENSGEIIGIDNVDGVLVGGASLRAESFAAIALA